ncbi:hypothetical protein [Olleya sp. Bg11-27]|uniref:hypothetical protein n=1 Tax=Olleya sp. Bg11-27 TaxID=2058135 RepID=UPI000C3185F3|nr:hypothetical protein [Olleya sp. Bg11-27]AUC75763.1 hypothetical protein CW732_08770 [Olleya sp. Bg11-27]
MKKLSALKLLFLATVILLINSCEFGNKKPNEIPPKQIVKIEKAINMFNTEKQLKERVINPVLKKIYKDQQFIDTEFAWFSLDQMRQYINYIDAIQKANPKENVSGIRVYLGRYNNKTSDKFANQQTVFFVPTVENAIAKSKFKTLNHLPFAIQPNDNSNPIKGQFTILESLVYDTQDKKERINKYYKTQKTQQKAGFNFSFLPKFKTELTSTILNEGELAPPPKKED